MSCSVVPVLLSLVCVAHGTSFNTYEHKLMGDTALAEALSETGASSGLPSEYIRRVVGPSSGFTLKVSNRKQCC